MLTLVSCADKQFQQHPASVPVIFDTDIGNDIDDVLALQILFQYEKERKIDLLGITISKSYARVVDYIDGYARLNNRGDIPLGFAYNGVNPEPNNYVPIALDTTVNGQPILEPLRRLDAVKIPEGYRLMRKLLAAQADSSTILIVVGPETNLSRLLESGADEFSSLSGVELVRKKVKLVSVMGGVYTDEFDFPEWNIVQDLQASKRVFASCPVPIVASGYEIGLKLPYPANSILNDFDKGESNPLVVSYKVYDKMPYDRATWDLTSVLYAVEPDAGYFDVSAKGNITVTEKGVTAFSPDENGMHRYLKLKDNRQLVTDSMISKVTATFKAKRP